MLWGVTSLACVPLDDFLDSNEILNNSEIILPDWILDARLIKDTTIGIVTAHNTFLTYCFKTRQLLHTYPCEEQSLLYAGQIHVLPHNDIVIASGTVFSEIQLWHPQVPVTSDSTLPIRKRLQGHEGCIFSLRFDRTGTLLASCSDDRTIRVWNLNTSTCIAIGFAHIARVWDVRFLPSQTPQEDVHLMSTSEDATALLWHLSTKDRKFKVLERYQGHGGKHVWSQAISLDGTMAATGGNDGAVNIWDIENWKNRMRDSNSDISWKEKTPSVNIDGIERMDIIKGYRCIDEDNLLVTLNSGYCSSLTS